MCELLWSDPQSNFGRGPSKRGVGVSFGPDVTKRFLHENNLGITLAACSDNFYGFISLMQTASTLNFLYLLGRFSCAIS